MLQSLEDETWFNNTNRRITGFISPLTDGYYEFELACVQFCDFILIENFSNFESNNLITDFKQRIQITIKHVKENKWSVDNLCHSVSPTPVFLEKNKKYLYDITSLINNHGRVQIKMADSEFYGLY